MLLLVLNIVLIVYLFRSIILYTGIFEQVLRPFYAGRLEALTSTALIPLKDPLTTLLPINEMFLCNCDNFSIIK